MAGKTGPTRSLWRFSPLTLALALLLSGGCKGAEKRCASDKTPEACSVLCKEDRKTCQRLCTQQNGEACHQLAFSNVSDARRDELFKRGCKLGSSLACTNAANTCPPKAIGLPKMIAAKRCQLGFHEHACKLAKSKLQKKNACSAAKRARLDVERFEKMRAKKGS
jgi:hypothetical protein